MRKFFLALALLAGTSRAFAQMPPYLEFECQIYDRICSDPKGDFCRSYEGQSINGQFPYNNFLLVWSPPATGCLGVSSICAAHIKTPPIGEVLFYYTEARNAFGILPECGPVPPPPGSGLACAYTDTHFGFHAH